MHEANVDLFRVAREGDRWHIKLIVGPELTPDIPGDYDLHLAQKFSELLSARKPEVQVDLGAHPAISSRQLGVLIALQRALRPKIGLLPLSNVGPAVLRLLDVTRTGQFFTVLPS